jgi:hypothetical protein
MVSPVVLMGTISTAAIAARVGTADASASCTSPVWVSANLLPRVASRRRGAAMALL